MISEELWGVGEPRGPQYMNVNWIGPAIIPLGSEEQRQRYFGPIAAGEACGARASPSLTPAPTWRP